MTNFIRKSGNLQEGCDSKRISGMNIQRCYEVLDLRPGSSRAELREVYKDLVQVWHPDRFSHNPRLQEKAQDKLKDINTAYKTLDELLQQREAHPATAKPTAADPEEFTVRRKPRSTPKQPLRHNDLMRIQLGAFLWVLGFMGLVWGVIFLAYLIASYPIVVLCGAIAIGVYWGLRQMPPAK